MYVALYEVLQSRWGERAADLAAETPAGHGGSRRRTERERSSGGAEGTANVLESKMEVEPSSTSTSERPMEEEIRGPVDVSSEAEPVAVPLRSRCTSVPLISPPAVFTSLPSRPAPDDHTATDSTPFTPDPPINPRITHDWDRRPPSAPPCLPSHPHRISAHPNASTHHSTSPSSAPFSPPHQDPARPMRRTAETELARRAELLNVVRSFQDVLGRRAEGWRRLEACEAQSMKRSWTT